MKAVIVDDEDGNIVVLKKQLQKYFPVVELVATSTNPAEAVQLVAEHRPDLLFLDIDMPGMSGFELLEEIVGFDPEVIFVTGYSEFALKAFEYHAAGYLTKPVNAEKLVVTVNAALERIRQKHAARRAEQEVTTNKPDNGKIVLSTQKGLVFVDHENIYHCESSGNYTNFFMKDEQQILVSKQIGQFEQQLTRLGFMRIHERYIVNLKYVREYLRGSGGTVILANKKELPVAVRRKEALLKCFESRS